MAGKPRAKPAPKTTDVPHPSFQCRIHGELWEPVTTIMLRNRLRSQAQAVNLLVEEALGAREKAEKQRLEHNETQRKPRAATVRQYADET